MSASSFIRYSMIISILILHLTSILSWLNVVRNFVQKDTYIKINSVEIQKPSKDANIIKTQVHNQKQITRYRSNEFIKSMCNNF